MNGRSMIHPESRTVSALLFLRWTPCVRSVIHSRILFDHTHLPGHDRFVMDRNGICKDSGTEGGYILVHLLIAAGTPT